MLFLPSRSNRYRTEFPGWYRDACEPGTTTRRSLSPFPIGRCSLRRITSLGSSRVGRPLLSSPGCYRAREGLTRDEAGMADHAAGGRDATAAHESFEGSQHRDFEVVAQNTAGP